MGTGPEGEGRGAEGAAGAGQWAGLGNGTLRGKQVTGRCSFRGEDNSQVRTGPPWVPEASHHELPFRPNLSMQTRKWGEGGHCPETSSFWLQWGGGGRGNCGGPLFPHKGAVIGRLFAASGASGRGHLLALRPAAWGTRCEASALQRQQRTGWGLHLNHKRGIDGLWAGRGGQGPSRTALGWHRLLLGP